MATRIGVTTELAAQMMAIADIHRLYGCGLFNSADQIRNTWGALEKLYKDSPAEWKAYADAFDQRTAEFEAAVPDTLALLNKEGFFIAEEVWTRKDFIDYLEETLIPDLIASGHDGTAEDFKTAVEFMETAKNELVKIKGQ